jgi:integrase
MESLSGSEKSSGLVDLRGDGRIVLYKRTGLKNPKWQVRIRVPNATGYRIVSSKSSNWGEAKRFAEDLYESTYMHVLNGGQIRSRTFKQVFDEWEKNLDQLRPNRQGGSWKASADRVRTYALPYFESVKIEAIGPKEFEAFWLWRKSNFVKKQPTNGTLGREKNAIAPLFKFAVAKGYILSVPAMSLPKAKHQRRPTFTLDEYRHLLRQLRRWVKASEGKANWRDKYVFQQVFLILANSGLRVGELRRLRWCDLRTVDTPIGDRLIGHANGKTGFREFVFQPSGKLYIARLRELQRKELGDDPHTEALVVSHRNGMAIQSFKRSFKSLLEFAKIPFDRDGMSRTIYSLRHFYATLRLQHEVNPFLLAKQMGTSVDMLEKFYGQTVTSDVAVQLTKGGIGIR